MKLFFGLILFTFSLSSFAVTKEEVEHLLRARNVSLSQLEAQGSRVILGEVTGHSKAIPFSQVQAILTDHEAIFKQEIEGAFFNGEQVLSALESFRFSGQFFLSEKVKATIIH